MTGQEGDVQTSKITCDRTKPQEGDVPKKTTSRTFDRVWPQEGDASTPQKKHMIPNGQHPQEADVLSPDETTSRTHDRAALPQKLAQVEVKRSQRTQLSPVGDEAFYNVTESSHKRAMFCSNKHYIQNMSDLYLTRAVPLIFVQVSSYLTELFFVLRQTGAPEGNLHRHGENMQSQLKNAPSRPGINSGNEMVTWDIFSSLHAQYKQIMPKTLFTSTTQLYSTGKSTKYGKTFRAAAQ